MKELNFFAGPSILDHSILEEAFKLIDNKYQLSVLEKSHRSKDIVHLFEETELLVKDLMKLDNHHKVLFLHGGASLQYCMVGYNVKTNGKAQFADTGVWSTKSFKECSKIRNSEIISSSSGEYNYIPEIDPSQTDENGFLHLTSNNTIYGTQYKTFPKTNGVLVADMSSDILSRNLDYNAFGLIYAGFQKNLGTAGGCLTIVDERILDGDMTKVPSMLDYKIHIKNKSMFNTPPVFAVLMCNLSLKWINKNGGLEKIAQNNEEKAALLYKEIDRNELFYNPIKISDRSTMNVIFRAKEISVEEKFLSFCEKENIVGLKGHRLSGGFRASLYNTLPKSHVEKLVEVLQAFERSN
jgi:phosphoserine aminotransferase